MSTQVKDGGWAALVGKDRAQAVKNAADAHGSGMGITICAAIDRALDDPEFVYPPKATREGVSKAKAQVASLEAEKEALLEEIAALKAKKG